MPAAAVLRRQPEGARLLERRRCSWAKTPLGIAYHDKEWGVPKHDDRVLFECLTLEGAQAGLSWETILQKRENYRKAFAKFDPKKVARLKGIGTLMRNPGIVRNRLKIESTISNAKAFLAVQKEFGSFDAYIWRFEDAKAMSKDLLKRGFRFVGPTICYAFMQAIGMVDDHARHCFRHVRNSH
jgi:DNA-3-methyladenine glycosylase I